MALTRVLEPEVMDTAQEAEDYDAMDHKEVNQRFAAAFLAAGPVAGWILDLGIGTARIPLEICRLSAGARVLGIDLGRNMLRRSQRNVREAGLAGRIALAQADAKRLPYRDGAFGAVISNSIVHHIPDPRLVLLEIRRVAAPGGLIFVRDLMRPDDDDAVRRLVATYVAGGNDHQQKMFDNSLRAALTLEEIRALVGQLGFAAETVQATSDRHWTWCARRT